MEEDTISRHAIAAHRREVHNEEGYRGIYYDREHSRWRAEIMFGGRRYKLGRFASPEAAAKAYDCAARKFYGAFAVTNQPLFPSQV